jgi:hypothetical protein
MTKSLEEVKELLSAKYLGKAGIHSMGISRAESAVRVYVHPDADNVLSEVLREIERDAAPYKIVPITSERPSIT